jgi:hypothetical protein
MPNHIENHLTIEGPQPDIDAFVKKAASTNRDGILGHAMTLNAFVPMPSDVFRGSLTMEDQVRTKGRNWYDWSIENWGTKWDCYESTFRKEVDPILDQLAEAASGKRKSGVVYGRVLFTFQTAWAGPDPVIKAMSEQHPTLKIKHEYSDEDSSGSNHGRNVYENGDLIEEVVFDGSDPAEDDPIRDLSKRLHGRDRYIPRCDGCDKALIQSEIKRLNGDYGYCDACEKK